MSPVRSLVLTLFVLPGCAGVGAGPGAAAWQWPFATAGSGQEQVAEPVAGKGYARFNFDWTLEGDPAIMPTQVFDDGNGMWLQFAPDGAWPAVFDARDAGWRPLSYRREPPYMRLDGVYDRLELRGGHLRGGISRAKPDGLAAASATSMAVASATPADVPSRVAVSAAPSPRQDAPVTSDTREIERPASAQAEPVARAAFHTQAAAVPGTAVRVGGGQGQPRLGGAATAAAALAPEAPPGLALPAPAADFLGAPIGQYAVSPADVTMRQALQRWAAMASWTFSPEHWAVDVDIPVVGQASFQADFKTAVRELLAATEMGDRPLQPCFYSNRVLRVVPYAQACDRRGGMGVVS